MKLPKRPFRRGICDGDDVWPSDPSDDNLQTIAALDAETLATEQELDTSQIDERL